MDSFGGFLDELRGQLVTCAEASAHEKRHAATGPRPRRRAWLLGALASAQVTSWPRSSSRNPPKLSILVLPKHVQLRGQPLQGSADAGAHRLLGAAGRLRGLGVG